MNVQSHVMKYPWAAPLIGGVAILALSFALIPRGRELRSALHHGKQPAIVAAPIVEQAAPPRPSPPQLQDILRGSDAAAISGAVDRLRAEGVAVTTAQVAHDLNRLGRPQLALAFLALRPDGQGADLWRLRFELARKAGLAGTGPVKGARQMLAGAVGRGSGVAPHDIVEAAYALDEPEMILLAVENSVVPTPDAVLALDLARRFERGGKPDYIARLDAVTQAPWRRADPWLAIRLARAAGRQGEALRYAMLLPMKDREAARETIVREGGDRAELRTLLLARGAQPGTDVGGIAEQLLAAGFREDAMLVLEQAAGRLPPRHALSQRLLYLMGPRPAPRELRWLQARAMQGSAAEQRDWIGQYVQRDRPQDALAFVARHPLANQPDVMMTRLSLARDAGDDGEGAALLTALLDQPGLTAEQLRALSAAAPRHLPPALARTLAERRIETGVGGAREVMDLAWEAWNRGDAEGTAQRLAPYLRDRPDDGAALRLMAEAQRKTRGEAAARPWRERALAQTVAGTRDQAEMLESLRRYPEAIAVVDDLLAARPADRSLSAFKARLLLANGQPGRARKVLQP
ncbi:hypothetical protein LWE61_07020 [Sphingobium sufflavum]|uniref:hypothetical protein n=1 Tax=Sphingobium sufflavum TaxID=1129547 RepID=UPI001F45B325|nr:hypothetical protein [Sphingobium sufflavum]MCE7796313.1 hypothetical protein [Sphingobium sufflavum]